MTRDKLLEKINFSHSAFKVENALLAVVELHKPDKEALCLECSLELNGIMQWAVTWPCLTIQVIEKALA